VSFKQTCPGGRVKYARGLFVNRESSLLSLTITLALYKYGPDLNAVVNDYLGVEALALLWLSFLIGKVLEECAASFTRLPGVSLSGRRVTQRLPSRLLCSFMKCHYDCYS